jgi:hypothetical protein
VGGCNQLLFQCTTTTIKQHNTASWYKKYIPFSSFYAVLCYPFAPPPAARSLLALCFNAECVPSETLMPPHHITPLLYTKPDLSYTMHHALTSSSRVNNPSAQGMFRRTLNF